MTSSRIVKATIGPILAKNLRLPAVPKSLISVAVEVDPGHPITKALMDQLPRLSDSDLAKVREHMTNYNGRINAVSKLRDVESWIGLIEEEIRFRAQQQKGALLGLLNLLSGPLLEGK